MECTSATKHKLPGIGSKKNQLAFVWDGGVEEIAGIKDIFLNQDVAVGMVTSVGF